MSIQTRERHGLSQSATYHTWAMMKQRCYNPKHVAYPKYGGRGITVCDRWRNSFNAFLGDMGERPEGMTLDRVDNDGPYSPENCRWATPKQQMRNTRKNVRVQVDGEAKLAIEIAEEQSIPASVWRNRLATGWSPEQALGLAERVDPRAVEVNGEAKTQAQWARELGISKEAVRTRLARGWDIEAALTKPRLGKGERHKVRTSRIYMVKRPEPKTLAETIGANVTALRLRWKWTQVELGKHLGVSAWKVCAIETGNAEPSVSLLMAIADLFGVSMRWLVTKHGGTEVLHSVNTSAMMDGRKGGVAK